MPLRLSLYLFLFLYSFSAFAEKSDFEKTGDILQIALPVSSLALTYIKSEQDQVAWKKNLYPFLKSFSVGLAAVHVQKLTLSKRRPNGDNKKSFPSGHTFSAFSGAAFNGSLYGYSLGIPSYLTAAVVGLSRIDAKQHFADDVLGGASIALLSNWYFTENMNSNQSIHPLILPGQDSTIIGLTGSTEGLVDDQIFKTPLVLFEYLFGPADVNKVQVSQQNQSQIELTDLPRELEHIYTSKIKLQYFLDSSDLAFLEFRPFEWINRGTLQNNLNYDGNSFLANQDILTDWRQYNLDFGYLYRPKLHPRWNVDIGGGALVRFSKLAIERQDKSLRAEKSKIGFLPVAKARILHSISRQLNVSITFSGMLGSEQWLKDLTFATDYQFAQRWGLSLQYNSLQQKTQMDSIVVENHQNTVWLGLSYRFF